MFIDMAKIAYLKQIKSFDGQISILKSRGMVIKDEARAKQIFAQVQKSVAWHHEELTKYLHHAVHDER